MGIRSKKEAPKPKSTEEILNLAITAEMEAHRFYLRAADQAKDSKVRATFLALAGDEEGHRLQLEGEFHHLYPRKAFQYLPGASSLHRYLQRELKELEALALAIRAEKEALSFYQEFQLKVRRTALKKILRTLADFEEGHRRLLEAEYQARMGRPWNDLELDLWVRE
jgi:rubrerythrin